MWLTLPFATAAANEIAGDLDRLVSLIGARTRFDRDTGGL